MKTLNKEHATYKNIEETVQPVGTSLRFLEVVDQNTEEGEASDYIVALKVYDDTKVIIPIRYFVKHMKPVEGHVHYTHGDVPNDEIFLPSFIRIQSNEEGYTFTSKFEKQ